MEKAISLHTVIEEPMQRKYFPLQMLFSFESKNQGPIAICLEKDVAALLRHDIWSQSTPISIVEGKLKCESGSLYN